MAILAMGLKSFSRLVLILVTMISATPSQAQIVEGGMSAIDGSGAFWDRIDACRELGFSDQPFLLECVSRSVSRSKAQGWALIGFARCPKCPSEKDREGQYFEISNKDQRNQISRNICESMAAKFDAEMNSGGYVSKTACIGVTDLQLKLF